MDPYKPDYVEPDPMEEEEMRKHWEKYPKLRPGGRAAISAWGWFRRNLRIDPRKSNREEILSVLRRAVKNEPIMGKRVGGKPITVRKGSRQYAEIRKQASTWWVSKEGAGKGLLSQDNRIFESIRMTSGKAESWSRVGPVRVVRDDKGHILTWGKS